MSAFENIAMLGPVDRAPYQITHLLRRLPESFSVHQPFAQADRAVAEVVAQHASNANDTLMHGLAALGHVMMLAGLNKDFEVEGRHVARLGDLITHMAVEAEAMQELGCMLREALDGAEPHTKCSTATG